jgi:hypothetical protein
LQCRAKEHPALSHDCFLDLSRLTTFQHREIDTAQTRGPLSNEVRARIIDTLAEGVPTLTPMQQQTLRKAFQ